MTIEQIKAKNQSIGHHWFSPDSMRFFKSRISETVYQGPGGIFFVSSEQPPYGKRMYSVRRANPDGSISTAGPFCAYSSYQAHSRAKEWAEKGIPEGIEVI